VTSRDLLLPSRIGRDEDVGRGQVAPLSLQGEPGLQLIECLGSRTGRCYQDKSVSECRCAVMSLRDTYHRG
jgi:hypothetical protein